MNSAKLTVRLPPDELEFAKHYAEGLGISLTALVHRYFSRLKQADEHPIPEAVAPIAGILPNTLDARSEYASHMESKHQ